MSNDTAFLALMLDAPLMSFGHSSRFQRRTTALHPTRSALAGMICAAAGADKGSEQEAQWLELLEPLRMTALAIPRRASDGGNPPPIRRMEDFHTVLDTRKADGGPSKDAVISHRQYLLDAKFGILFSGGRAPLEKIASALSDPRWGVWFGRKSCIPAAPVLRRLADSQEEALASLGLEGRRLEEFNTVGDAPSFSEGTDTLMDSPVSFADRRFKPRRVCQTPAQQQAEM